ncbi:lipopolysaccharide transport system ATP-binding protein [Pedobacter sp. W3I1]|uniref:ABC transporter ATP-binding protein n=1 Tax=Pedobacter sp. W3I1 TaxID=3042291 RepID=UPI0027853E78|nr:ABC transporter ATP-binding protein [Pedobacter sp. W3I1]MDQ0640898.1 lipopolysaccharide transport system ATP-binding protein [Pedobacter sp. W3I1]
MSKNIAIKVENLSKAYQLGQIGTGTISRDLERWYARIRGKEDPFLRIGESNNQNTKSESDIVWSLKDINFEIEQGDAVGIIGRNGAGKSTLLKILSKVTSPTTGKISGKGRIASLLEVGTGFHPELSGRENIFLNGAILGMRKKEIQRKLDEIVDFAGIERYLDTPVKRYSSGMYVRLAFAVAAHLESEILIVDEVLAVGDAEFQKKCLGKMGEVSKGEGRTVLFVSHNMAAVNALCSHGILLNKGKITFADKASLVIEQYFNLSEINESNLRTNTELNKAASFKEYYLTDGNKKKFVANSRDYSEFVFELTINTNLINCEFGFIIRDHRENIIFSCNSRDNGKEYLEMKPGNYDLHFSLRLPLSKGSYEVDIAIVSNNVIIDHWQPRKKITIITHNESVLEDKWVGILNEPSIFSYDKKN